VSEAAEASGAGAGRSRWLKLFSSAVIDQALLSAANFLVGLLLIRNCSDEDYGHYVLGFTALLLLTGLQGAYIGGPLAVLAPRQSPERKRRMLASLYHQSGRWTGRIALGLALLCGLLGLGGLLSPELATLGAVYCAVGAFALQREYLRTGLMIYERPQAVLRADLVYVALLLAGVAAAALTTRPAAPWAFAAMAFAALAGGLLARRELARSPGLHGEELSGLWRELAPLGGWAMAGWLVYWSFSQGYNYVVAGTLDLVAVAALNAVRLLLMPANLMVTGIKQLLLPMAARWHQSLGLDPMLRRLLAFAAVVMALSLIYFGLLWLLRDWVFAVLLKKQFADRDQMLLLWMLMFLLSGVRDLLMTALLVREQFRSMTGLSTVAAVLSLLTCWLGTQHYGAAGAILGLVLGEAINLVGVLGLILRERRLPANPA
jgi:O-antigen/teichoic acid export membrane protein